MNIFMGGGYPVYILCRIESHLYLFLGTVVQVSIIYIGYELFRIQRLRKKKKKTLFGINNRRENTRKRNIVKGSHLFGCQMRNQHDSAESENVL